MFHQWYKIFPLSLLAIQTICLANPELKFHLEEAREFEENDQLEKALESAKKAISKIDRQTDETQVLEASKLLIRLSYDSENYAETIRYATELMPLSIPVSTEYSGTFSPPRLVSYRSVAFRVSNRSSK